MELNLLTQQLFSEGYTKEHPPEYVRPFDRFYGGFTYCPDHLRKLVFETPCGLLVTGEHFISGMMSYQGVDWMAENNNPTVCCPRFSQRVCSMNHPLLQEQRTGDIRQCACHLTNRPYDYRLSLDKAHDDVHKEADELFEIFNAEHFGRACKHRSRYDRITKQWQMFYDPMDCARDGFCHYCDVLQTELAPEKGNVFYDLKISRTEKGFGLFPDEPKVMIIKDNKLLSKTASMTLCEAIVRQCAKRIREKEERRALTAKLTDPTYTVEVFNLRAQQRSTRDLRQDLIDAANGIQIIHEGDFQKDAAQRKRENRQKRRQGRVNRMEKLILQHGLDGLPELDQHRAKKLLDQSRIEALVELHGHEQLRMF